MNTYTEERLKQIAREGYSLHFNEIWNNGFTIWKKVTAPVLGALLLLGIPVAFIYIGFTPWIYGVPADQFVDLILKHPKEFEQLANSQDVKLKMTVISFVISLFFAPIAPGIMKMCYETDRHGNTQFGHIFSYYRPRYYAKILVVSLVTFVLVSLPSAFIPAEQPLILYGYYVYAITASVLVIFAVPLIIFADASPFRALGVSIKLAAINFFPILGFLFIGGLFALLGFFACCIGLLFSITYIYIVNYLAYKQAIGFEGDPQEEESATPIEGF